MQPPQHMPFHGRQRRRSGSMAYTEGVPFSQPLRGRASGVGWGCRRRCFDGARLGCVAEPGTDLSFTYTATRLNLAALAQRALTVLPHESERGEEPAVPHQGIADNRHVAKSDRQEKAEAGSDRRIFQAHQKAVLDRVPVYSQGQLPEALGGNPALMPAYRGGHIEAFPAQQLRPPGKVGILAIGEEI